MDNDEQNDYCWEKWAAIYKVFNTEYTFGL